MKLEDIKKVINNNKAVENVVIRDAGSIPVNQPTKMFVSGFSIDIPFANITVAAEVGHDQYIEKDFSFKAEGKGRIFFDKFLNTAFPDQSTELNTQNILGKSFIGMMVINDGHENLEAVGPSDDAIVTDGSESEFMNVDGDELPFL